MSTKTLVPNIKGKSAVWKHFGFEVNSDQSVNKDVAVCKLCFVTIKYSNSTTNLTTHMRRHHPSLKLCTGISSSFTVEGDQNYTPVGSKPTVGGGDKESSQTSLQNFMQSKTPLPPQSKRANDITKAITNFIIKDLRPFIVVENEGFVKLINELEPRYKIPSRSHFSEVLIPALYESSKKIVHENIKSAKHVALTTDSWTSRSTDSYVTITCMFLTQDWTFANYVLQTRKLDESHTGNNLAAVMADAIKEWNIPQKPSLVTDNARNMLVMASAGDYMIHIGCFAHTINLAVQKALKLPKVEKLLSRVRRIVAYFHRSTTACAVLKEKND